MKACMLEVYMAMMNKSSLGHVLSIVAQMVYARVVLRVHVDWRIIPSN
jgi:hypothetical protein